MGKTANIRAELASAHADLSQASVDWIERRAGGYDTLEQDARWKEAEQAVRRISRRLVRAEKAERKSQFPNSTP